MQNYVPRGGTITLTVEYEYEHPTGHCIAKGTHTFSPDEIPKSAWRNSNLQVSEDRYVLNIVLSGDHLPMKISGTCTIAGRGAPYDSDVNDARLELTGQHGNIAHGGVAGKTEPPIRQLFTTLTGTWTFVRLATGAR